MDPDGVTVGGADLVGPLVDDPHAHVLQQGQHGGQGERPPGGEQLEAQQPVRLQGLGQAQRDVGEVLGARLHVGDVGHCGPGREVVAVGGREGASVAAQEAEAPLLAIALEEGLGEVVGPRPGGLGDAGLDDLEVGGGGGAGGRVGVDDEVQPGQHRLPHLGVVLVPGPGEGGQEDVGDPLADGLGVAVERHVDETAPVAAEAVAAGEEPHPLPLLQRQDPERRVVELVGGDLEQLQAGQRLDDLGQGLGVVGGGGEAGPVDHRRHRAAQHGDVGRGRLVHGRGVEAEEPPLAGEGAVGAVALEADVVEGRGPVDRRPGRRLGENQRVRGR